MADPKAADDFVMKQEDASGSGVITCTPGDAGGTTRWGLCKKWHPELDAKGFYDGVAQNPAKPWMLTPTTVPEPEGHAMAEAAYGAVYTAPLCLTQIQSQAIATAMLSFAVVEGQQKAVQLLQAALDGCGASVTEDGGLGPKTVDAVNETAPAVLLNAWIKQEEAYFAALGQKSPVQERFVAGWDNRAELLRSLL